MVMIGPSTDVRTETLSIPLGSLDQANIKLSFGGGELEVHQAEAGHLVSGLFEGGVVAQSKGDGYVELRPFSPHDVFVDEHPRRWNIGITSEIPVDLELETGANRSTIDLCALRIRHLEISTGASDTSVGLPATGETSVHVQCGLGSMKLEVPHGVAARIESQIWLGSTIVDETRFPRVTGGWASVDYESAADRVDISAEGGLGSVLVE
jgi:hypothetical protein